MVLVFRTPFDNLSISSGTAVKSFSWTFSAYGDRISFSHPQSFSACKTSESSYRVTASLFYSATRFTEATQRSLFYKLFANQGVRI